MTTTTDDSDGGKARFSQVGVFKCPSGIPMDAFVEKCGEVMAAIIATPVGDKLLGLKIMSPDAKNNARLEQLGWTVDKTTVTTISEFASAEDFFVTSCRWRRQYAADPEVKQIFQKAQEAFGNETRLFVADVVRKQDDVASAWENAKFVRHYNAHFLAFMATQQRQAVLNVIAVAYETSRTGMTNGHAPLSGVLIWRDGHGH
ncbi:hypothetical protein GGX14DRAFT_395503 [Mycena pura]|uniref:Uncharacterized protein n=1 Tax=Mycena pura TaxID=153505 RepID=A0AAD6YGN8_9AGAR|nr:hypothetical protein GGX14DRAFT_395503 [Mycena pura]